VLRQSRSVARLLRTKDRAPVTADEESFTAVRHQAIRSMTSSQITASSSLEALAATADAAARAALHALYVPGRQRHSKRARKARPKFARASIAATRGRKHALTQATPSRKQTQRQKQNARLATPRNTTNTYTPWCCEMAGSASLKPVDGQE
jgi:hypothetical protein